MISLFLLRPFPGLVPATTAAISNALKKANDFFPPSPSNKTKTTLQPNFANSDTTPAKRLLFTKSLQNITVEQGSLQSLLEYLVTTDGNPVSATLMGADAEGKVPRWLRVNRKTVSGLAYTTGSEISFDIDATNLPAGRYRACVTASTPGYKNAVLEIIVTVR